LFAVFFVVDSASQTVIINESMSSDGSVGAQLQQQAYHLTAASVASQPVITSTSSAPDVFYSESRLPGFGTYHDNSGIVGKAAHGSAEFNSACFDQHGGLLPEQQIWAGMPSRQDVTPQPQLPAYRPAPDYDTVMQQRILSQCYPSYVHPYLSQDCTSFSQPDIYQQSAVVGHWNLGCARTPVAAAHGGHPVDRASSLVIHPEAVGVARHASAAGSVMPRVSQYLCYRAPPPYPRQSSSTPDLASPKLGAILTHGGMNLRQHQLLHGAAQSQFDESLENLAAEVQQVHVYDSRSVDPGYRLSGANNSSVQSGIAIHPAHVLEVSRPSTADHYGHSASTAGARFDPRNNKTNRLDFIHHDEYVSHFFSNVSLKQDCFSVEARPHKLNTQNSFILAILPRHCFITMSP